MKIILGDFNEKLGRDINFKPTIGNESLHQDSNDNSVRIVSFFHNNNSSSQGHDVPYCKIRKYNRPLLMGRLIDRLIAY